MKIMSLLIVLLLFSGAGLQDADRDDPVVTGDEYWQHTDGPYGGSVWSLYTDERLILAGTLSHGILFSNDGGETWLQSNLEEGSVYDIARAEDGTLIAIGQEGAFLSFNNGRSWEEATDGLGNTKPQAILTVDEEEVHLAGIGGGMFLWDSESSRWLENNEGLGLLFGYSLALHDGQVYAGITNDIYRWDSEQESWEQLNLNLPGIRVNDLLSYNGRLWAATQQGLYVSDESGTDWEQVSSEFDAWYTYSLAEFEGQLYIGTRQGVYATENGSEWRQHGLAENAVYSLSATEERLYSGGNPGVFFMR